VIYKHIIEKEKYNKCTTDRKLEREDRARDKEKKEKRKKGKNIFLKKMTSLPMIMPGDQSQVEAIITRFLCCKN